jgi:glycerophosphoryl diester phosphodiesterase
MIAGEGAALPLVVAHRGYSAVAPENTVAAIDAAAGIADWVEFDVRETIDGELILMHDSRLRRTTNGGGLVASSSFEYVRSLDAGLWFGGAFAGEQVPTLAEAIEASFSGSLVPLIERKTGSPSLYVGALRALGVTEDVVLQSFDWTFLANVHFLAPEIMLGALGSGQLNAVELSDLEASGVSIIAWKGRDISPLLVNQVHARDLDLFAWTIDQPDDILSFVDLGLDGIISNDPGLVRALVPEPSTAALISLGLLGLLAARPRRRLGPGPPPPWAAKVAQSPPCDTSSSAKPHIR